MLIVVLLMLACGCWADEAFGVWKMNSGRSSVSADRAPRNFTLRIERHAKGEVFTVERTEPDGRSISDSTILFLDGKAREYQDAECTGTQSSERVDSGAVQILRTCETGGWMRVLRRVNTKGELILDVIGQRPDGRQVRMRLMLEKQ